MNSISSFSGLASGVQWGDLVDQMMSLESSRRLTPIKTEVASKQGARVAWSTYQSLLQKLTTAAAPLRDRSAFSSLQTSVSTSASGKTVLSASASASATPGSYSVEVVDLARADKISGSAFSSTSAQLGISGEFYVNGRKVDLASTDSLTAVRDKINAVNSGTNASGVSATILSTSATQNRLVLTSENTGARGMELVDGDTDTLGWLGIQGATTSRNASPIDSTKTDSQRFTSTTTALAAMLGVSAPPAVTTISIDGQKIQVDLLNDTMLTVMNKLQAAGGVGVITDEVVAGKTYKRLTVEGNVTADATAADVAASQRIVELMGFVKGDNASTITSGRDSVFRIDGFTMTRRTNTVSDAVPGLSLNLLTAGSSERTSSITGAGLSIVNDPKTIDPGAYAIALTTTTGSNRTAETDSAYLSIAADPGVADGTYAVSLTEGIVRSSSSSSPSLQILATPGSVSAGDYDVQVSALAASAVTTGTGFGGSYSKLGGSDTVTITDGNGNSSGAVSLSNGMTTAQIVTELNSAFSTGGVAVTASNVGGQLRLTSSMTAGSTSTFTVAADDAGFATNTGIADGAYSGSNIQGTIGGLAATGSGNTLTGTTGAATGLSVRYTGGSTGLAGTATVTDTATVNGGTIGGFAATWDSINGTLTANAGTALDGLSVTYTGAPATGAVGNVIVSTVVEEYITGATINGEAATWDASTNTINGVDGSDFDGLSLGYSGPATSGNIGIFSVAGDIAVTVDVNRDLDATVKKVQEFATAYNELVAFVDQQKDPKSSLYANGTLRSMQRSITSVFLSTVSGLSSSNPYSRSALAGVTLTKPGALEVDATKLKAALSTNLSDVQALFGTSGTATDGRISYVTSTAKSQPGTYAINITAAATQATHLGTALGGGLYTATNGVSDVLTITDVSSGKTVNYTATQGATLTQLATGISSAFANEGLSMSVETESGGLRLRSTDFGTAVTFTIGGAAATGLGFTSGTYAGTDVAGTIGGLAAVGAGRILTGATDEVTEGISIRYTGTGIGATGDLSFVLGVSGMIERVTTVYNRAGDGTIASQLGSIDSSIETLNRRASDVEARLQLRRDSLSQQFIRMEQAMSILNSQSSWLSGQVAAMNRSTE